MSLHTAIDSPTSAGRPPIVIGAWPRLLDAEKASMYMGIGRTFFLDCVATNTLPQGKRIGRRVLWDRHVLDEFVDALFGSDVEMKAPNDEDW